MSFTGVDDLLGACASGDFRFSDRSLRRPGPAWRLRDPADEALGVGGDQYGRGHRDDHGHHERGKPVSE